MIYKLKRLNPYTLRYTLLNYPSINRKPATFLTSASPSIIFRNQFSFVNLPITSKYYHIILPGSLQQSIKLALKQEKLNEKCFLLQHIVQIIQKQPKLRGQRVNNFFKKQLSKWAITKGNRFQRAASIAWIIKKMGLKKQLSQLYNQIFNRIEEDQWYVDFQETIKVLQAFSDYHDKQRRDKVFEKIQRNLLIILDDCNMNYYQRICLALVDAQRFTPKVWDKIEKFVLRGLGLEYTARTFFDIFKCFIISKNGSNYFYEICQEVIYKGHLLRSGTFIRNNLGQYNSTGDYFALFVQTYALVMNSSPIVLNPQFLNYLYKSMIASKIQYKQISSLTKILKNMEKIEFHETQVNKVVFDIIETKQFSNYGSFTEIQSLYFALEERFKIVPLKLQLNVEKLVRKDMQRNLLPLQSAIQTVQFLLSYHDSQKQADRSSALIQSLNEAIERKFKYLEYEESQIVLQCLKDNQQIEEKVRMSLMLPPGKNKQIK